MGLTDIVPLDAWTITGWQGFTWRSFGQQVGVVVQPVRPGEVTLWCCRRPRLATTLVHWGASQRSAQALTDQVREVLTETA